MNYKDNKLKDIYEEKKIFQRDLFFMEKDSVECNFRFYCYQYVDDKNLLCMHLSIFRVEFVYHDFSVE
jgi:hypothetical protein